MHGDGECAGADVGGASWSPSCALERGQPCPRSKNGNNRGQGCPRSNAFFDGCRRTAGSTRTATFGTRWARGAVGALSAAVVGWRKPAGGGGSRIDQFAAFAFGG